MINSPLMGVKGAPWRQRDGVRPPLGIGQLNDVSGA